VQEIANRKSKKGTLSCIMLEARRAKTRAWFCKYEQCSNVTYFCVKINIKKYDGK